MAVLVDDFGNAAHGVLENVVGMGKGLVLRDVVAQHVQQLLVEHDDQRIDVGFEFAQAAVGVGHASAAFPLEGLGDHAHGEDAHFLGHARDHGRSARARAAAHAGCDEQHVRAFDGSADVVLGQLGGFAALVGLAARTQAAATELDGAVGAAAQQRLRVGVGADELHALHVARNHVLDGIAAAAANADHLDLRTLVEFFNFNHVNGHVGSPVALCKWSPPSGENSVFCPVFGSRWAGR
ncbi:MAG: hypothetical protein GAK34_02590 [Delftia tsuruhatensis]|nr:MAG: hypothetical protein GAK34_02590 [Delftia tsuruhatensis]